MNQYFLWLSHSLRGFRAYCLLAMALASCQLFQNSDITLADDFFRVYNIDSNFSYQALDIQELPGEGYLIYGARLAQSSLTEDAKWTPYLLKVDTEGQFVWDTVASFLDYDEELQNRTLVRVGDNFFFGGTSQSIAGDTYEVYQVDPSQEQMKQIYTWEGITNYVSIAEGPNNSLILGSYDCSGGDGGYHLKGIDPNTGTELWSDMQLSQAGVPFSPCSGNFADLQPGGIGYYTTDDGDSYIYARLLDAASPNNSSVFRFSLYRFNETGQYLSHIPYMQLFGFPENPEGVRDMSLSLYQSSSSESLTFATANFNSNGADILIPEVSLDWEGDSLVRRDNGFTSHEYRYDAPVFTQSFSDADGNLFILYVGTTWSGQILLTLFDGSTLQILNKKYLGYKLYYEARRFVITEDKGYAIYGHTLTSGRFQQLCLFKFSETQFRDFLVERNGA